MKLQAAIFDWAGTLVDFGSRAPIAALQSVFASAGVPIQIAEARESMGLAKKDHIRSILSIPRVREAWIAAHAVGPSEASVERLYADFVPSQTRVLENHAILIPGVVEAIARFRARDLKIGTTTGYNRAMLDFLLQRAAAQGFVPDCALCPDDVPAGRPLPWMCFLTAIRLDVYPPSTCVKIGDTPVDIEEGRNAGMWTIGVTHSGNEVGLSEEEWNRLDAPTRYELLTKAEQRLSQSAAHFTAPSVADCDSIFDQIESRLSSGEKP